MNKSFFPGTIKALEDRRNSIFGTLDKQQIQQMTQHANNEQEDEDGLPVGLVKSLISVVVVRYVGGDRFKFGTRAVIACFGYTQKNVELKSYAKYISTSISI